jgi:fluoroacetyl-CoA thioesterase
MSIKISATNFVIMNNTFKTGDTKTYIKVVSLADIATFESGTVHSVYATFSIARDAEWACRLFVLAMKEDNEEGIGTFVHVNHHAPALVNDTVVFIATIEAINGNEIICSFTAHVGNRLIANGRQGQKILKKEKIERLFNTLQS